MGKMDPKLEKLRIRENIFEIKYKDPLQPEHISPNRCSQKTKSSYSTLNLPNNQRRGPTDLMGLSSQHCKRNEGQRDGKVMGR